MRTPIRKREEGEKEEIMESERKKELKKEEIKNSNNEKKEREGE